MVFSSLSFLFLFLPIFLICYYLIKDEYKNGLLFLGSLLFYGLGEPSFLLLMLTTIVLNFFFGLIIEKCQEKTFWKGTVFITALLIDFGTLFFFKYTNFFLENINALLRMQHSSYTLTLLELTLPLGISFYTFQIVSYIIDVYKGSIAAEHSLIDLGAYIAMFPQLIAGPIVMYSDIHDALKKRTVGIENLDEGLKTFILGLGYKVILANRIGLLWNEVCTIGYVSISTPLAWLGALSYALQLYFDFCGYSLMAIGLGKMLGFTMPENFRNPYMARSVTEFWRKWHMTLGTWFRTYVYIPLGGNRKGKARMFFNLFVVWFLVGLWHGASWNFILWGLFIFIMQMIEKGFLLKWLEKDALPAKLLSHLYMIFYILVSWILFAVSDFSELGIYLSRMFGLTDSASINSLDFLPLLSDYGPLLALGIFCSTDFPKRIYQKLSEKIPTFGISLSIYLGIFWYAVYFLAIGISNPFLYFRF